MLTPYYKAIKTKYHGPSNFKGSRYSATDCDSNRVILSADDSLGSTENHKRAAAALVSKMKWGEIKLIGGHLRGCMVWVMFDE